MMSPVTTPAAQANDCSMKSAGSNMASAIPRSSTCWGFSMRFWASGLVTMTCSAFSGPIRLGNRKAPPQPGTRPRKHSGSAMAAAPELMVR